MMLTRSITGYLMIIFLWLGSLSAIAQKKIVYIYGTVTDSRTREPLDRTNIFIPKTQTGINSKADGSYQLKVRNRESFTLTFSYLGYKSYSKQIVASKLKSDSLEWNVALEFETHILPIYTVGKPLIVHGNPKFSISDYEFFEEKFVFLIYNKNLKKGSKVVLADKQEKLLSTAIVDGEAIELYKDHIGNINVICTEKAYKVKIERNKIILEKLDLEYFNNSIKPCIDTLEGQIVFTDYRWHFPEFNYYTYNPEDSSATKIKNVVDAQLARLYRYEYYYLQPREKLHARKLAMKTGNDKHEIAAWMTNFPNSLYYTPLYAPLFVVDDTIIIFDHYTNKIYRYNEYAEPIDSTEIDYHKVKWPEKWKRELFIDEQNDNIYTAYLKNGYYYMRLINTSTGKLTGSFQLANKYVEQIKVRNDWVYYIYRPFESVQKKYLYRELIR